jgi:hypothetical protein
MAERRPLVLIGGRLRELPAGDTTAGATGGGGGGDVYEPMLDPGGIDVQVGEPVYAMTVGGELLATMSGELIHYSDAPTVNLPDFVTNDDGDLMLSVRA